MDIRPFRGWRYPDGDVSAKIAPPYDILDQADKDELLSRSEQNIVAVDLPHVPPKELGPEEEYDRAASLLEQWKSSGVLVQDESRAIYAYEQTYTWAGKTYSRRSLLLGVRATPLGVDVIPHEHTFAGPKADRLKLTTVTRTQLSSIFGFYTDPTAGLTDAVWAVAGEQPNLSGELNGVQEKLWVITDEKTIQAVQNALADVPVYIADGHHRYTTTMNYSTALREAGEIDENHEANFVLFTLVAGDDAGLLVLPTHRVVAGLSDDFSLENLREIMKEFTWKKFERADVDWTDVDALLEGCEKHTFAVMGEEEIWLATLADPAAMKEAAPDHCEAWRELDVAILHELIVEKALAPFKTDAMDITYTPDGESARKRVATGDAQVAICLRGTPIEAVKAVADAGESMPHKSTYFYPKLATGMVLKPLE
jgi:uncharacterized protein (DUF1015 family)